MLQHVILPKPWWCKSQQCKYTASVNEKYDHLRTRQFKVFCRMWCKWISSAIWKACCRSSCWRLFRLFLALSLQWRIPTPQFTAHSTQQAASYNIAIWSKYRNTPCLWQTWWWLAGLLFIPVRVRDRGVEQITFSSRIWKKKELVKTHPPRIETTHHSNATLVCREFSISITHQLSFFDDRTHFRTKNVILFLLETV